MRVQTDPNEALSNRLATYSATGTAYAGYATPTDMLTLSGSASKTVAVTGMSMLITATAAALQVPQLIKRSAANTGGTASTPAGIPHDSADPAATAVARLYSVIPSALGAAVGVLRNLPGMTGATAGAPGLFGVALQGPNVQLVELRKPVILRGVAEQLCFAWNGVALPAGFAATWAVEWVEFDGVDN